jgi:hypothetical protein
MKALPRFLIGQAVLLVVMIALFFIVLDKVPAIYEVTAPVLCPSTQPDALVVEYHETFGDTVGTSHTLLCIGPDGDVTEVGSWKPLALTSGALWLALEAVVLPIQVLGIIRRRRRPEAPPPPPFQPPGLDHPSYRFDV